MLKLKPARVKKKPPSLPSESLRQFGEMLGQQLAALNRTAAAVGLNPSDPFRWKRLAAIARTEFGMNEKEFGECDPAYLMALIERRLGTDGLMGNAVKKPEPFPVWKKPGSPLGKPANGELLRSIRGEMTQQEFADIVGVAVSRIRAAEKGERLGRKTFQKLAARITERLGKPISEDDLKKL